MTKAKKVSDRGSGSLHPPGHNIGVASAPCHSLAAESGNQYDFRPLSGGEVQVTYTGTTSEGMVVWNVFIDRDEARGLYKTLLGNGFKRV